MVKIGELSAYDVCEVAKTFGVTVQSVRKYLKEGRLKGNKMGTKWFVTEESIREFLTNR
jgi:excisionase family DNA binding protein